MKINFLGKNFDIPPIKKGAGVTAGMFAAGVAAGMSGDNKLPEIPKGPLDAEAAAGSNKITLTEGVVRKKDEEAYAGLAPSPNLEGGDGNDLKFIPDDFSFEQLDSIPNPKVKYGYQQLGTRKLVGGERAYFGSEKTTESGPYSAKRAKDEPIYTLGHVFPGMDSVALFENYGPDGTAYLVELTADTEVFKKDGKVYAVVCGNLLVLRDLGDTHKPERVKKPETKIEAKESYDGYKMVRKDTYENGDMIISFDMYQGTHKVDFIGPIYLIKDRGVYVEVDSYAWEHSNASYGRGRLLPTEMPVRDSGVRKFKDRATGQVLIDALPIPTDANGKKLTGADLRKALIEKHIF